MIECIRPRLNEAAAPQRRLKSNVSQQKMAVISGNADTPFRLEGRNDHYPKFYVSRHRSARYCLNSAFVFR